MSEGAGMLFQLRADSLTAEEWKRLNDEVTRGLLAIANYGAAVAGMAEGIAAMVKSARTYRGVNWAQVFNLQTKDDVRCQNQVSGRPDEIGKVQQLETVA